MHEYFIIWTYEANYGTTMRKADTAEKAAESVLNGFSDDFRKKGTVYVFESTPDFTYDGPLREKMLKQMETANEGQRS